MSLSSSYFSFPTHNSLLYTKSIALEDATALREDNSNSLSRINELLNQVGNSILSMISSSSHLKKKKNVKKKTDGYS
jgi:hypothetical protein